MDRGIRENWAVLKVEEKGGLYNYKRIEYRRMGGENGWRWMGSLGESTMRFGCDLERGLEKREFSRGFICDLWERKFRLWEMSRWWRTGGLF